MYIKLTNGTPTPYTIGQLRKDNQNTSFPRSIPEETLAAYDVYPYTVAEQPDFDKRTQIIESGSIAQQDGSWVQGWTVTDKTAEQIASYDDAVAEGVRIKRNNLLAETDWMGLSDVTMSAEMATYRQALRDITSHENFPYLTEADWPTKP